jgi:hypothetical protein
MFDCMRGWGTAREGWQSITRHFTLQYLRDRIKKDAVCMRNCETHILVETLRVYY